MLNLQRLNSPSFLGVRRGTLSDLLNEKSSLVAASPFPTWQRAH
jgi:hypothetical protein